ncbi:MAG: SUMF1/EgtB/PvdO family nonheme iron enzyme [Mastigocoleus sp.]
MNTLVGRYEITRQLGGGGFAITFLARDIMQPSQPLCVVKQLRPNQDHPRVVEFFHKEAAILEKLGKHPQIPQLFAHFQEGDNLYIVQEFIQGHDLSKEISPGKRLSEAYVKKLLQDILEVLSFVHKYGVIHRDIKPQNLMRRQEDEKIFLIDFGAVKELGSLMVNTQGEIKSSVVISTPGFMPSEQGQEKPCFASDVYALGMSAISALTGLQPFELEANPQTGEVIWLQQAQVSQHLGEVITKMVRRHYSLRYSSAKDALQDLISQAQSVPPVQPISQVQSVPTTHINPRNPQSSPSRSISKSKSQQLSNSNPLNSNPLNSNSSNSSPSNSNSFSNTNNLQRRKLLRTMGLVGGGFIAAILGQRILPAASDEDSINSEPITEIPNTESSNTGNSETSVGNNNPISADDLQSFDFETVTVDAKGAITNRRKLNAKYFAEDLGNGRTLEMVQIPGGIFTMGSPSSEAERDDNEGPQREVKVPGFYMGRYEVTQAQYEAIMGKNPGKFKGSNRPVELVSWDDAKEFCKKLSEKVGRTYRLPSEAEWEYACRARTITPHRGSSVAPGGNPHDRADPPFYFGDTITADLVNYDGNFSYGNAPKGENREQTTDVGSFPPNAFGLYDMHGNVYEWCEDTWHVNYNGAPTDGSAWIDNDNRSRRILRGGSWVGDSRSCRCANRSWTYSGLRGFGSGFRIVLSSV